MDAAAAGLIEAAGQFPGARVCEGEAHPLVMQLADEHADHMALTRKQGHQNFQERFDRIRKEGIGTAHEICAESWPWQEENTMLDLGLEMFKCWKQSPGHWRTASKPHKWFGAAMSKGSNGIWYACIIGVQ